MKAKKPRDVAEAKQYIIDRFARLRVPSNIKETVNNDNFDRVDAEGIDCIILDLVEWRAVFYAFDTTGLGRSFFERGDTFRMFKSGGYYAVYSKLTKLVEQDKRCNSLYNLWDNVYEYIDKNQKTEHIDKVFKGNRFSNKSYGAIFFRNKVLIHNERSFDASLEDLDSDIQLLFHAWKILSDWSGSFLLAMFKSPEEFTKGFECFFNENDIKKLQSQRSVYINMILDDFV